MDQTNLINDIRKQVDIVDIISSYVPLAQKGKNYFGVCPFHDDTNPSMSVSRDKQIYKCFSCGASGNVFNFIMNYEHVSFPEALKIISEKSGIEIKGIKIKEKDNKYQKYYDIYDLALKYFHNNINTIYSSKARDYLLSRNIDDDIIKEYNIGFSLDKVNDLSNLLINKGYNIRELNDIGLSSNNNDIYINRIMFPLYDLNGRCVAFSGRRYDGIKENKYINTKQTPIFTKGDTLYNYHIAKNFIRSKNEVIVMEGFMAVIRSSVNGIKNTVALMGTAMTLKQAELIKRLSNNVILAFDGDEPGRKASLDNGLILQKLGCNVKIVMLTDNLDPDDYILKYGIDKFKELIKNSITLDDYRLNRLKKNTNFNNDKEKSNYINSLLLELSKIDDDIEIELVLKKLEKEFNLRYNTLEKRLLSFKKNNEKKDDIIFKNVDNNIIKKDKYYQATYSLLYYLLTNNETLELYNNGKINFINQEERYLASEISYYLSKYNDHSPASFLTYLEDKDDLLKLFNRSLDLNLDDNINIDTINDYIKTIREYQINEKIKELKKEIDLEDDINKQILLANKIRDLKNNL